MGYNLFWWIAVSNAARGEVWIGAWALLLFVGLALWWTQRTQRTRETQFLVAAMSIGWGLDSVLHQWGAIQYPSSEAAWVGFTSPPWIAALWLGFATMPRYSLGWLKRHPAAWAVVFGAVGGPLAFYGGTRFGAIEAGFGWKTYAILALEYGLLTWALVATHARLFRTRKPPASPRSKA